MYFCQSCHGKVKRHHNVLSAGWLMEVEVFRGFLRQVRTCLIHQVNLKRCVSLQGSQHWGGGNRMPANLNYAQQGGHCTAMRTGTPELINRRQSLQDIWDSATWSLISPPGPFGTNPLGRPTKRDLMGYLLLAAIYHRDMTFTIRHTRDSQTKWFS